VAQLRYVAEDVKPYDKVPVVAVLVQTKQYVIKYFFNSLIGLN